MYPYGLRLNPYPSSPTPSYVDSQILGGKTHKDARQAIVTCISDLYSKLEGANPTDRDFRLITMIQDVGSGKTHLAFHIKGLPELVEKAVTTYVDLSQVSPRSIQNIYDSILGGFSRDDVESLRRNVLYFLCEKADRHGSSIRKAFNYGFLDNLSGNKHLKQRAEEILGGKHRLNFQYISKVLATEFSDLQNEIIKSLLEDRLRSDVEKIRSLEGVINSLSAIADINLKLLNKVTIFQFDEFDSKKESLEFIKAIINAHIPSSILMLILTPSSYDEIKKENSSVFDRLEKANYKIDLAGSNTLGELKDILFEYIKHYDKNVNFNSEQENDLESRIKLIYDEFPDFRNVRSMLNIFYHATEQASKKGSYILDESIIDETIKSIYPGSKIRGSLMNIPLTDFIQIKRSTDNVETIEPDIREAIRNLLTLTNNEGYVNELNFDNQVGEGIDVTYNDSYGSKVAVSVAIKDQPIKTQAHISNASKSLSIVDKLVVLTGNASRALGVISRNGNDVTTIVNMDNTKIVDLMYFNKKYKKQEILDDDLERAITLARSIKLC
ncbi:MAG TPA: hypothetical protein VFM20_04185 [Nitrososphaeraceae archaeon]|nr:hypothetical protein [Nitrososphaeraceae archaeon]